MASIRGKNTRPELLVRKILWSQGKRYRVHDKSVPGIPDISSKKKRVAVFIDGCFWHGCSGCYKEPTTNVDYWRGKVNANRKRRDKVRAELQAGGWRVLEFWEHEVISGPKSTAEKVAKLL